MVLILGSLVDPVSQQGLLRIGEFLVRIPRGHEQVRIVRDDALDQGAFGGFAWQDRSRFDGLFGPIESQIGLAMLSVRSMAIKTILREDRTDVPIELDPLRCFKSCRLLPDSGLARRCLVPSDKTDRKKRDRQKRYRPEPASCRANGVRCHEPPSVRNRSGRRNDRALLRPVFIVAKKLVRRKQPEFGLVLKFGSSAAAD